MLILYSAGKRCFFLRGMLLFYARGGFFMKKKFFIYGLLAAILLSLCACAPTSHELSIEKTFLAKFGKGDQLIPMKNDTFKRGDKICFVLLNVGPFKKDRDGLNNFDMDMTVTDPNGKIILSVTQMLGDQGHVALPDNIAASPYGIFSSTTSLTPGKYQIKLTIYDKIDHATGSRTTVFTLT